MTRSPVTLESSVRSVFHVMSRLTYFLTGWRCPAGHAKPAQAPLASLPPATSEAIYKTIPQIRQEKTGATSPRMEGKEKGLDVST